MSARPRRWLLIAAFALSCSTAEAGDWDGIYLGVNGGYLWSNVDDGGLTERLLDITPSNQTVQGGVLGGQLGLQRQYGNWVFGIEATYNKARADGRSSFEQTLVFDEEGVVEFDEFSKTSRIDNIFTIAGRIGHAWSPRLMTYAKVGYASASVESRENSLLESFESDPVMLVGSAYREGTIKGRHHGFVLGAGIETKVHDNIVLGLGYDYINLRSRDDKASIDTYFFGEYYGTETGKLKVEGPDIHMVTARVSILFGHEERPAPLK